MEPTGYFKLKIIGRNFLVMRLFVLVMVCSLTTNAFPPRKPLLIVTTDIGQDPDDLQSLVRLLHYADMFTIAGIVANADANYAHEPPVLRDDLIHEAIDAYAQIEYNLRLHSSDFPSAKYLHSIVKKGCAGNGKTIPMDRYIGDGKDTEGSDWIIRVADNSGSEPVHVSVWGGACDLAQALWKVKTTRSKEQLERFIRRLRVFFIGRQDSSNQWILETFPGMWIVLADHPGGDSWQSAYRGMFLGGDVALTSRQWLEKNVTAKSPLGKLYPLKAFTGSAEQNPYSAMKEGDSPAFLFFIRNGLNDPDYPGWGGWGGRYREHENALYRDSPDTVLSTEGNKKIASATASVFRWRPDFQRDFAARIHWGNTPRYGEANHYPFIVIEGFPQTYSIERRLKPGDVFHLNASASSDPDDDALNFEWFLYPEAGTNSSALALSGTDSPEVTIKIAATSGNSVHHVILRVTDNNRYPLSSYLRVVLTIIRDDE